MSAAHRLIRGRVLSFTDDPAESGSRAYSLIDDGAVLVAGGLIEAVGEARDILARAPAARLVDDHSGSFIMPGFIDAHVHYPQTQVIGSHGAQLLDWLHNYTFVEEQKFADPAHCARVADFFLDELFRSGTTTAMVYCTVHPQSVDALLRRGGRARRAHDRRQGDDGPRRARSAHGHRAARLRREQSADRALAGPRPARLCDHPALRSDVDAGATGGRRRAWRANFRTATSRPTPTKTRRRSRASPALFPEARSYLDVYARAGLLGPRSVFGHCIHLQDSEVAALAESRSVAAFCPTSNLFLGSGLFDQARLEASGSADRACDRRRRGHELFDAAHGRRGLQGAAAQWSVVAGGSRRSTG